MKICKHVAVAAFSLTLITGCAGLQPSDPYAIRVRRLETKVANLQKRSTGQNLASLADRTDNIESQLRQLRGEVQTLSHTLDQTNQRQRNLYQDVDQRLRTLETKAGVQQSGGSSQPSVGLGANPGNPSTSAQPAETNDNAGQQEQAQASNQNAEQSGSTSAQQPTASGRKNYQHAFDLLKQGRYQDAEAAFHSFLKQHPDSPLADNGQYWLAEVNYVDRDFKSALSEFQKVSDNYPNSPKAPDALLKVGYCNYELEQYTDARQALNKVISQYSDSTAARLARQRLKRMKSSGH